MDLYTSTDCYADMARARYTQEGAAIKQAECDRLKHQEELAANACPPNCPTGEELSDEEQFCQDKMNSMSWADVVPNPKKEEFYSTCVDERLALAESNLEEIESNVQTAGTADTNLLMYIIIGGAVLWFVNTAGIFKK